MADESDDRWTVRGVSKAARDAAAGAAQRRKVTVGAWLAGAIDREVRAEREPLDLALRRPADNPSDTADTRLAMIERTIAAAVSLAGARGIPAALRKQANALLREGLPEPAPAVVVKEQRRLPGGKAGAAGKVNGTPKTPVPLPYTLAPETPR